MSRKQYLLSITLLSLVLFPPLVHALGNSYLLSLASRVLIYGLAAASLDLLLGYGAMVSLGHAAFIGIGAYTVGILGYHHTMADPWWAWSMLGGTNVSGLVSLPLAALVAALAALIIGALSLRTTGMHFIMITLAFAQMLYYFFISLEQYGGDDGLSLSSRNHLPGLNLGNDTHFYYLCLACLVGFLFLASRLVHSRFGLILRGAGDNERRVKGLGVNAYRYKLALFTIAGASGGLAGALLANHSEFVSPGLLNWTLSGELMVMVLLGGLGTLFGPVVGATAYLLLEEGLTMHTEHWMVYMGPLLILAVLFAKDGLFALFSGKRTNDA